MKTYTEYSHIYNKSDFDRNHLPAPFDISGGIETFEEAVEEIEEHIQHYNSNHGRLTNSQVSREDYTVVKRQVTDWEVAE